MAGSRHIGRVQPLSHSDPTTEDLQLSHTLSQALNDSNAFEDLIGMDKREELRHFLDKAVQVWVAQVAERLDIEQGKEDFGARVLPYGGHLLDVVMKESDLDVVCIVPSFVRRDEFFTSFVDLLRSEVERLTHIRLVRGARVPILELCIRGIEVDICLARIPETHIPENFDFSNNEVLADMENVDIWSLNGYRESSHILDLVPDVHTFRQTLKAVKLWTKLKCIQTCPVGYPGGIAWTIMVARVCQLYPKAAHAALLEKVFNAYKEWHWPSPVMLQPISKTDPYDLKPWNPKENYADTFHVMPVITSSYPEKNCAFAVNRSALTIITENLKQADHVVGLIRKGQASWNELFTKINFFSMYKHFLLLEARAPSLADSVDWSGLVYSRSRVLVEELEKHDSIDFVHAYPKAYKEGFSTKWFWGLRFTDTKGIKLYLAKDLYQFQSQLAELAEERGFYKPGMTFDIHHLRRKDLPRVVPAHELV